MSWTRLTDTWVDTPTFYPLTYSTRWHYLAMIQHCSRNSLHDGVMRMVDAKRASDVPEPDVEISTLIAAELVVQVDASTVRIVHIADHVPSADLLAKLSQDRARSARYRKHKAGDHSECSPDRCKEAPSRDASRQSSRDARDGTETGRAVTGSTTPLDSDEQQMLAELADNEPPWRDDDPDYTQRDSAA